MVKPMRAELSSAGFKELYNASDVASEIGQAGTTMVVVNSVCGCAARNARPGAKMSLENAKKPEQVVVGDLPEVKSVSSHAVASSQSPAISSLLAPTSVRVSDARVASAATS